MKKHDVETDSMSNLYQLSDYAHLTFHKSQPLVAHIATYTGLSTHYV